ncbi:MAG: FtsQ-type POTRA domain-containing protein [Patescibacteria group bacterium]
MIGRIKTHKNWQRHVPNRPQRLYGSYYGEYQKKRRQRLIRIIWLIAILLLGQSIFQLPFLQIKNINVSGNQDIDPQEVKLLVASKLHTHKYLIFKNDNYFLASSDALADALGQQYNLSAVTVKKKFPNSLEIVLKEKTSQFIWQKDGTYYLMDAKGALNRQIEANDNKHLVLDDRRSYKPAENQDVFRSDELMAIQSISEIWQAKIASRAALLGIVITDDWRQLELQTDRGYYVKLDGQGDIAQQMDNLYNVLTAGNISGTDISYIDVRFADKIFFK